MVVGHQQAVFGDEEARTLAHRTHPARTALAFRSAAITLGAAVIVVAKATAELIKETLHRVIVRQVIKAPAVEIEIEAAIVSHRLHFSLDAHGDHGRGNGFDDISKAGSLGSFDTDGIGEGAGHRCGHTGGKQGSGDTCN